MRAYPQHSRNQGFRRAVSARKHGSSHRVASSRSSELGSLDTLGNFSHTEAQHVALGAELATANDADLAKKQLLSSLVGGDDTCAKEAAKIRSCRAYISVDGTGEASAVVRSCNSRFCVHCFKRDNAKKRRILELVFKKAEAAAPPSKFNYCFITLTLDPKKTSADCKEKLKQLRRHLSRFFHSRDIKKINLGSFYRIETGKKHQHFNHHVHVCLISSSTKDEINNAVRKEWKLGEIIKIKRWRVEEEGSMCREMTKGLAGYLSKPLDAKLHPSALRAIVSAFKGCKLNGSTGLLRQLIREAREEMKSAEEEEIPAPPALPPEAVPLPAGNYEKVQLLELSIKGSSYALYCLKLLRYRKKYGFKFNADENNKEGVVI